jgi:hypothetical protein
LLTLAWLSSLPLSYVSIKLFEDDDFKTSRTDGMAVRPPEGIFCELLFAEKLAWLLEFWFNVYLLLLF